MNDDNDAERMAMIALEIFHHVEELAQRHQIELPDRVMALSVAVTMSICAYVHPQHRENVAAEMARLITECPFTYFEIHAGSTGVTH